jgi:hypothetical protein
MWIFVDVDPGKPPCSKGCALLAQNANSCKHFCGARVLSYLILSYKLNYIVIHCYTEYYITIIISYYITLYYTRMLFWTFASALRLFNLWYIVDLLQRAAFAEHLTLLKYGAVPTSFLLCHEHRDALWVLKQWFVQLVLIRETLWWHVMTWWDIQPYFPHFQHLPSCPWEHCCQKGQELSSTLCSGSSTFLNFCSQGALVTLIEKMWLRWNLLDFPTLLIASQDAMTGYDPLEFISAVKQLCTSTA